MIYNDITLSGWDNRQSTDGVMNLVYDDDIRLMNILFAPMTI